MLKLRVMVRPLPVVLSSYSITLMLPGYALARLGERSPTRAIPPSTPCATAQLCSLASAAIHLASRTGALLLRSLPPEFQPFAAGVPPAAAPAPPALATTRSYLSPAPTCYSPLQQDQGRYSICTPIFVLVCILVLCVTRVTDIACGTTCLVRVTTPACVVSVLISILLCHSARSVIRAIAAASRHSSSAHITAHIHVLRDPFSLHFCKSALSVLRSQGTACRHTSFSFALRSPHHGPVTPVLGLRDGCAAHQTQTPAIRCTMLAYRRLFALVLRHPARSACARLTWSFVQAGALRRAQQAPLLRAQADYTKNRQSSALAVVGCALFAGHSRARFQLHWVQSTAPVGIWYFVQMLLPSYLSATTVWWYL